MAGSLSSGRPARTEAIQCDWRCDAQEESAATDCGGGSRDIDKPAPAFSLHFDMKTLQVRIPDQLRHDADAVLAAIGLDLPTAVRLYLNKIVQTRSIPFSLQATGVTIEALPVDRATQAKMDGIATAWKKRRS